VIVHLDFETRSEADLKKCGAYEYARHASTEVICAAYMYEGEDVELWTPGEYAPIKEGDTIRAHNAEFERCIIHRLHTTSKYYSPYKFSRGYWPDPDTLIFECTAALASYNALPRRLEKACAALGVAEKDMAGHRAMLQMAKPRPTWKSKGTGDKYFGGPERLQRLYAYCMDDVIAENALHEALGHLPVTEQRIYDLDQRINRRGVYVDTEAVSGALSIIKQIKVNLCTEIQELTNGYVKKPSERDKIIEWFELQGTTLDNLIADMVENYLSFLKCPTQRRILEIRLEFMKKSTQKFEAMRAAASPIDGRARGMFLYHAAGTGRWGGRVIQMQNLPRGDKLDVESAMRLIRLGDLDALEIFYDSPMNVLSTCIRSTLRAEPGKRFLVADFSAIEARITMWLARDPEGLKVFRAFDAGTGPDPYIDQASIIYSLHPDNIISEQRQVGKMSILGLGFGMGADTFREQLESLGVDMSDLDTNDLVELYRNRFSGVVSLWRKLNSAAMKAVKTRQVQDTGYIKYGMDGDFLRCKLPSGRCLSYFEPRLEQNRFDRPGLTYMAWKKGQWMRTETYGGKLTENVVQAIARDVLVDAMLRAESKNYPIVIHVHDELVTELPYSKGSLQELENLMSQSPGWASNCPIQAEGWEGEYYRK